MSDNGNFIVDWVFDDRKAYDWLQINNRIKLIPGKDRVSGKQSPKSWWARHWYCGFCSGYSSLSLGGTTVKIIPDPLVQELKRTNGF